MDRRPGGDARRVAVAAPFGWRLGPRRAVSPLPGGRSALGAEARPGEEEASGTPAANDALVAGMATDDATPGVPAVDDIPWVGHLLDAAGDVDGFRLRSNCRRLPRCWCGMWGISFHPMPALRPRYLGRRKPQCPTARCRKALLMPCLCTGFPRCAGRCEACDARGATCPAEAFRRCSRYGRTGRLGGEGDDQRTCVVTVVPRGVAECGGSSDKCCPLRAS